MTEPPKDDQQAILPPIDAAERAARFFESYANTTFAEYRALAENSRLTATQAWTLIVDAASAYREAGQWAAVFDTRRSQALLEISGRIFWTLNHGFGHFLITVTGGSITSSSIDTKSLPEFSQEAASVEMLMELLHPTHSPGSDFLNIPPVMRHPQQQAYLLLSLAAKLDTAETYHAELTRICNESPHRVGGLPVGALGMPIRHYWGLASEFLRYDSSDFMASHLVHFLARYDEVYESARLNRYLWVNGAAPIDVVDIDVAGVIALAARSFGESHVRLMIEEASNRLSSNSRWLVNIGIKLAENG